MRQVTYTMHFRGQASRSGGERAYFEPPAVVQVRQWIRPFEQQGSKQLCTPSPEISHFWNQNYGCKGRMRSSGTGTLTFGDDADHALRFSTLAPGHLAPSPVAGVMAGAVSWKVTAAPEPLRSHPALKRSPVEVSFIGSVLLDTRSRRTTQCPK